MNNTRISNPVGLLSFGVAFVLVLVIGFVAWLTLSDVNIDFGGLTLSQVGQPEQSTKLFSAETAEGLAIYHQSERSLTPPKANAEGLAVYHQSERGLASPRANEAGLAIYHQSERDLAPTVQSQDAGLEIYWQSERGSTAPFSKEDGMEIYQQSERNIPLFDPDLKDVGMEIYYASERGR